MNKKITNLFRENRLIFRTRPEAPSSIDYSKKNESINHAKVLDMKQINIADMAINANNLKNGIGIILLEAFKKNESTKKKPMGYMFEILHAIDSDIINKYSDKIKKGADGLADYLLKEKYTSFKISNGYIIFQGEGKEDLKFLIYSERQRELREKAISETQTETQNLRQKILSKPKPIVRNYIDYVPPLLATTLPTKTEKKEIKLQGDPYNFSNDYWLETDRAPKLIDDRFREKVVCRGYINQMLKYVLGEKNFYKLGLKEKKNEEDNSNPLTGAAWTFKHELMSRGNVEVIASMQNKGYLYIDKTGYATAKDVFKKEIQGQDSEYTDAYKQDMIEFYRKLDRAIDNNQDPHSPFILTLRYDGTAAAGKSGYANSLLARKGLNSHQSLNSHILYGLGKKRTNLTKETQVKPEGNTLLYKNKPTPLTSYLIINYGISGLSDFQTCSIRLNGKKYVYNKKLDKFIGESDKKPAPDLTETPDFRILLTKSPDKNIGINDFIKNICISKFKLSVVDYKPEIYSEMIKISIDGRQCVYDKNQQTFIFKDTSEAVPVLTQNNKIEFDIEQNKKPLKEFIYDYVRLNEDYEFDGDFAKISKIKINDKECIYDSTIQDFVYKKNKERVGLIAKEDKTQFEYTKNIITGNPSVYEYLINSYRNVQTADAQFLIKAMPVYVDGEKCIFDDQKNSFVYAKSKILVPPLNANSKVEIEEIRFAHYVHGEGNDSIINLLRFNHVICEALQVKTDNLDENQFANLDGSSGLEQIPIIDHFYITKQHARKAKEYNKQNSDKARKTSIQIAFEEKYRGYEKWAIFMWYISRINFDLNKVNNHTPIPVPDFEALKKYRAQPDDQKEELPSEQVAKYEEEHEGEYLYVINAAEPAPKAILNLFRRAIEKERKNLTKQQMKIAENILKAINDNNALLDGELSYLITTVDRLNGSVNLTLNSKGQFKKYSAGAILALNGTSLKGILNDLYVNRTMSEVYIPEVVERSKDSQKSDQITFTKEERELIEGITADPVERLLLTMILIKEQKGGKLRGITARVADNVLGPLWDEGTIGLFQVEPTPQDAEKFKERTNGVADLKSFRELLISDNNLNAQIALNRIRKNRASFDEYLKASGTEVDPFKREYLAILSTTHNQSPNKINNGILSVTGQRIASALQLNLNFIDYEKNEDEKYTHLNQYQGSIAQVEYNPKIKGKYKEPLFKFWSGLANAMVDKKLLPETNKDEIKSDLHALIDQGGGLLKFLNSKTYHDIKNIYERQTGKKCPFYIIADEQKITAVAQYGIDATRQNTLTDILRQSQQIAQTKIKEEKLKMYAILNDGSIKEQGELFAGL